jgi:hypothetical protein
MASPVLTALAQVRMRAAPMFARWCELNGVPFCPAAPAAVAKFVTDCAPLGIERLWPAVLEISETHTSLGLADPTLGGAAATAINGVGGLEPPRSWPENRKQRFKALPYDLQVYVVAHEARREKALRRAQNEAANARQNLAALRLRQDDARKGNEANDVRRPETDAHGAA